MFQYATARALSGNRNVFFDLSFLQKNSQSNEHFTAKPLEITLFDKARFLKASSTLCKIVKGEGRWRYLQKFLSPFIKIYIQQENEFVSNLSQAKLAVHLDGYFQSEKYFRHIREQLLNEFQFPGIDEENKHVLDTISANANSVSIHVRRGDYLKVNVSNYMGVLPLNYYSTAINLLEAQVENPFYVIFSDDPDWVTQNFNFLSGRSMIMSGNEGANAWKDMYLMTKCKHHIVANSSFSWWGAWLSTQMCGFNFAPKNWFNPKAATFDIHDFVPSSWQIVEYD